MNCCFQFLLLNFLAGCFIFIILGLFVIADNPFLIMMNLKEIDGKKEYGNKERRNAYLQYFTAAGFSFFFAFIIWYIDYFKVLLGKGTKKEYKRYNPEMKIKESDDIINKNNTNQNIILKDSDDNEINKTKTKEQIASINTINTISTGKELGMTEKTEY